MDLLLDGFGIFLDSFVLWECFDASRGVEFSIEKLNAPLVVYFTRDDGIAWICVTETDGRLLHILLNSNYFDRLWLLLQLCVVLHESFIKGHADFFIHVLQAEIFEDFVECQSQVGFFDYVLHKY